MCEKRSSLREARLNLALVWNRASEKDLIVSFAQGHGMDILTQQARLLRNHRHPREPIYPTHLSSAQF
jgi:hypothetical protein